MSFLAGRGFSVQGDSIASARYWQPVVAARTGMVQVGEDARPSRSLITAFECWGNPAVGAAPGTFNINYVYPGSEAACGSYTSGYTNGMTFAQSLANVDIEIIALGTNDQSEPIGTLGDATTAGTFLGNLRWVVETYLSAKPTMRVVLVTPQYNAIAPPAVTQQYVNAMVAYGGSMGVPVINMFALGGLNSITAPALTADGTHPNQFGDANFYGPVIANAIITLF
jgi:hypothetical protein